MQKIVATLILALISGSGFAQCCSAGSPLGGTTNQGVLAKQQGRLFTFYRTSYSETFYTGDKKAENYPLNKDAFYHFSGLTFAYGITNRLTAETELGYYFLLQQNFHITPPLTLKGSGLSNGVVSVKYNIFNKPSKAIEYTVGIGFKFPFSEQPLVVDGLKLPVDLQPSTNAPGIVAHSFFYKGFIEHGLRFFLMNRYEYKFSNIDGYTYGANWFNSLFVSKSINHHWTAILQVRNEIRQRSDYNGKQVEKSGGTLLFLSPQINYNIRQKWNLSVLVDLPVYQNYNETQLSNKYGFSFNIVKDFDFSKKVKPTIPDN